MKGIGQAGPKFIQRRFFFGQLRQFAPQSGLFFLRGKAVINPDRQNIGDFSQGKPQHFGMPDQLQPL